MIPPVSRWMKLLGSGGKTTNKRNSRNGSTYPIFSLLTVLLCYRSVCLIRDLSPVPLLLVFLGVNPLPRSSFAFSSCCSRATALLRSPWNVCSAPRHPCFTTSSLSHQSHQPSLSLLLCGHHENPHQVL